MKPNHRQTPATTSTAESEDEPRRPPSTKRPQRRRISSKRTRDLPDLSGCHSCGFRTDSCSGDNGLLILYSEWRIVLLCAMCFQRVESSQICSYCFKEPSGTASYFTCSQCHRIVHGSCFSKYRTSPPWSYSSSGSGFSFCVDCWLPITVARKRGLLVRRSIWKGKDSLGLGDSNGDCWEKDASPIVDKKFDPAIRTNELHSPRRTVELVSNALNFIADTDVSCDSIKYNTNDVGLDVTGLALQSPRSMDNSSGVLNNFCSVNLDSVAVPKMHVHNRIHKPMIRFTYSTYSRCRSISRKGKICHGRSENIFQPSVSIMASSHDSTTSPNSLKTNGICGVATGACPKVANGEVQSEKQEESFSYKFTSDHVVDNDMNAMLSEEKECTVPENERCNEKRSDRYMMGYSRRKLNERSVLD